MNSLSDDIRTCAIGFRAIKQSSAALKNDDFHALFAMDHEELTKLAWNALNLVDKADTAFGYSLTMLEEHVEGSDDAQCSWIISQSQPGGGFNKHCKNMGGYSSESGPGGDTLVFDRWSDALNALNHMNPDVRPNFRIYPVVVFAGKEPRTTPPKDSL